MHFDGSGEKKKRYRSNGLPFGCWTNTTRNFRFTTRSWSVCHPGEAVQSWPIRRRSNSTTSMLKTITDRWIPYVGIFISISILFSKNVLISNGEKYTKIKKKQNIFNRLMPGAFYRRPVRRRRPVATIPATTNDFTKSTNTNDVWKKGAPV